MATINKEMLITEALSLDSGLVPVLQSHGLNCFSCASSRGKTLEMAAVNHGIDIEQLISDMNAQLQK